MKRIAAEADIIAHQRAIAMIETAENDLTLLRGKLLEMGAAAEELVRDAVRALTQQDAALAKQVILRDDLIDELETQIEVLCLRLMTQPLAISNFRLVGAALKAITDIERIGDHAVDISRVAQRMQREMIYKELVDIPQMGEVVCRMLNATLNAFVSSDFKLASTVLTSDPQFDALCSRTQAELHVAMQRNAESISQASHLLFVVHYLERIGDHCANIAERVSFIETGQRRKFPRETLVSGPPKTPNQ